MPFLILNQGVVFDRAEKATVWDVDGNEYIDCLSAYSAVNQ
jgi:ornithine--oxo-acid transaminase